MAYNRDGFIPSDDVFKFDNTLDVRDNFNIVTDIVHGRNYLNEASEQAQKDFVQNIPEYAKVINYKNPENTEGWTTSMRKYVKEKLKKEDKNTTSSSQ